MWLRAQRAHSETCGRSHRVRGLRSAVLRVRLADTCRSSRTTETCADQPSRRAGALPPPARASPAALPASALAPRGEGGSATRQAAPFLRAATRLAHTRNGGRRGAPAPRSLAPPACATRRRTAARSARRQRSRASLSRVAATVLPHPTAIASANRSIPLSTAHSTCGRSGTRSTRTHRRGRGAARLARRAGPPDPRGAGAAGRARGPACRRARVGGDGALSATRAVPAWHAVCFVECGAS